MTHPLATDLRDLAIEAASIAAARHHAGGLGEVDSKSSATDPVTQVDRDSERLITEALLAARPDDSIFGEEGVDVAGTSGVRWIIDPLDGTVNYLYGFPAHAVSIAAQIGDHTVAGVVHDTAHGVVYAAAAGHGATRDGAAIVVGRPTSPGETLLATGFAYSASVRRRQGSVLASVIPQIRDIRRAGSAALDLCFVAAGTVDAYYETGPHIWDVAAGMLIVEEAGGRARYDPSARRIIAAGGTVFDELDAVIGAAEAAADDEFGA